MSYTNVSQNTHPTTKTSPFCHGADTLSMSTEQAVQLKLHQVIVTLSNKLSDTCKLLGKTLCSETQVSCIAYCMLQLCSTCEASIHGCGVDMTGVLPTRLHGVGSLLADYHLGTAPLQCYQPGGEATWHCHASKPCRHHPSFWQPLSLLAAAAVSHVAQ